MGTKYVSETESGYNASPPADDGSAVSSNEVKWSFIKTKLADVVKTLAEGINTKLLVTFNQEVVDKATTFTTTTAEHDKTINITAAATQSLGDAGTMGVGYIVTIKNSHSAANTVDLATGADTLDGTAAGSVSLPPDTSMMFIVNAGADGYKIQTEYIPRKIAVKAGDEIVSNSTTMQDDDDLVLPVAANAYYKIELLGTITNPTSSTPDFKYTLSVPSGTTVAGLKLNATGTGAASEAGFDLDADITMTITSGDITQMWMKSVVNTSATAGDITFRWAQLTADVSDTTVQAGTSMELTRIA